MSVSFKDRVAIVTGGAGALGSSFCILLAKLGCKVVVNDLVSTSHIQWYISVLFLTIYLQGTSVHGDASNASPAAKLVEKIKSGGGVAIADTHDVCDGPAIIAATLSAFGRIDIIIHCAGILHDASFAKTTLAHWNDILKVHLTAGMALAQAAWPHMSKQKYGRLLFVGSTSGLYGNFGQSGYSSAKMGVWGLAHTLAIEGEKHGIHANVIVPTAISRYVIYPDLPLISPIHTYTTLISLPFPPQNDREPHAC
jgi:NAD(P)-dependent dehydrogenase (short-subunit alcohol dehydrogenase family)